MSLVKCEGWPNVLPDDDGIRPAGDASRCFYCNREVGEPHGRECVTVLSKTRYGVYLDGERVGTWRREDPFFWTEQDRASHKNESSWCADNAMDTVDWVSDEAMGRVDAATEDRCACGVVEFRVDAIEDAGPFVEIRRKL